LLSSADHLGPPSRCQRSFALIRLFRVVLVGNRTERALTIDVPPIYWGPESLAFGTRRPRRPKGEPFDAETSDGGGVHAATMTVGLHENRNENLHGGQKSTNSFGVSRNTRSERHGMGRLTKDQLTGFMVASWRGFMVNDAGFAGSTPVLAVSASAPRRNTW
jgi:hypothetical protein